MVVAKKGRFDSGSQTSTLSGSGEDEVGVNLNFARCLMDGKPVHFFCSRSLNLLWDVPRLAPVH